MPRPVNAHFDWIRGIRDSQLTATAKHVAHVLATFMDGETGECFPSRGRVALGVGRSPSTVTRALRELEREGWIETERQMNSSNLYRRTIPLAYVVRDDGWGGPGTGGDTPF